MQCPNQKKHCSHRKQSQTQQNGTSPQCSMLMWCFPGRILRVKQQCGQSGVSFSWPSCCKQRLWCQHTGSWFTKGTVHIRVVSVQYRRWVGSCIEMPAEMTFSICFVRKAMEGGWVTKSKSKWRWWMDKEFQGIEVIYVKYLYVGLLFFYNNSLTASVLATTAVAAMYVTASVTTSTHAQHFPHVLLQSISDNNTDPREPLMFLVTYCFALFWTSYKWNHMVYGLLPF